MTSALSITRAVAPPRAAFVDFPLGHTTGKPHDRTLQRDLLRDALAAFETIATPGEIVRLPYSWDDDDGWKESTSFGRDDLLLLAKVADKAHTWIHEQGQQSADKAAA